MRKAPTTIKPKGLNDEVVEIVPLNGASDTANAFVEAVSESGQQPVLPIAQVDTYHRDISICPASNRMVASPSPVQCHCQLQFFIHLILGRCGH